MLADDAAKHCCRNWLLFEGGAPFPVAAPTVVDAEGAELSGKPLVATMRRRHAARGGRDHQGVDGRWRVTSLSCVFFGRLPARYVGTVQYSKTLFNIF